MDIRLYLDEDAMARSLVKGLRARGIDVKTVFEENMTEQNDRAQLEYATREGRAIYTFNVGHFSQLHTEYTTQGKNHAGIIVVHRQRYSIGEQIHRILKLISKKTDEDMKNNIFFL